MFGDIAKQIGSFLKEYGDALALAAHAASVYKRNQAAERDEAARRLALDEHKARQDAVSKRSRETYQALAENYAPQRVEEGRKAQEQRLNEQMQPREPVSAPLQKYAQSQGVSAPQIVGQQLNLSGSKARDTAADRARRSALAASFGANAQQNAIRAGETADRLRVDADASRGNARILPYALQAANTSGNKARRVSDILGGLGNLAQIGGQRARR